MLSIMLWYSALAMIGVYVDSKHKKGFLRTLQKGSDDLDKIPMPPELKESIIKVFYFAVGPFLLISHILDILGAFWFLAKRPKLARRFFRRKRYQVRYSQYPHRP